MTPEVIVGIAVAVLMLMLVTGVPVAFGLATAGALGLILLDTVAITGATLGAVPYQTAAAYTLVVVPMFIFMGILAAHAGIGADVLALANKALGRLPGGLGVASVAACAGFAAVTGSSVATVATIGRLAIGEMAAYGYSRSFAAGIVGAGGTLGILIPPSIILVIYGVITGESVGALLLAGLVPGVLSALVLSLFIVGRAIAKPELVGGSTARNPSGSTLAARPDVRIVSGSAKLVLLFAVVIGGIYTGVFTPTESGAIGALLALLMVVTDRRKGQAGLLWRLSDSLREAAATTSMVFLILIGAGVFSFFLVSADVPRSFTELVLGLDLPPHLIVLVLLLALIPLGMFLDGFSILVIAVPLTYPVVTGLGFDGIWWGILVVKMIELGLITPPIGVNAYVLAAVDEELTVEQVFRGLAIFWLADLCMVGLLFAVPWLTTVVPDLAGR